MRIHMAKAGEHSRGGCTANRGKPATPKSGAVEWPESDDDMPHPGVQEL
jgi:hypothetical protein